MRKFIKGFGYAFSGIYYAFKTQVNFRVHLSALILVILAGYFFKLSANEWIWIAVVSGIVLTAELINTAIEVLVDLVSPAYHEKAKVIKDVAAAAVLVTALLALVTALIIFTPKICAGYVA